MQAVFDPSVIAHGSTELFGIGRKAADVVAPFGTGFTINFVCAIDHANALQVRSLAPVIDPFERTYRPVTADFYAPMIGIQGLMGRHRNSAEAGVSNSPP